MLYMCLLYQLLMRERSQRLGFQHDAQEVKEHPFFDSIDWDLLEQRKVRPPYNPRVVSSKLENQFTKSTIWDFITLYKHPSDLVPTLVVRDDNCDPVSPSNQHSVTAICPEKSMVSIIHSATGIIIGPQFKALFERHKESPLRGERVELHKKNSL